MNEERLHELLTSAGDSGRARAELEAWPVVRAAYAAEPPGTRRRFEPRAALLVVAAVVGVLFVTVAAAGSPEWSLTMSNSSARV